MGGGKGGQAEPLTEPYPRTCERATEWSRDPDVVGVVHGALDAAGPLARPGAALAGEPRRAAAGP